MIIFLGLAVPSTAVTVNGNSTYRKGEYFHYAPVPNTAAAQYTTVTVNSGSESSSGKEKARRGRISTFDI